MTYINVGATTREGMPLLTKKALRSYLADDDVRFYSTSSLGGGPPEGYTVKPGTQHTLSVCGPDPYSNRKWYATVNINGAGKVVVA